MGCINEIYINFNREIHIGFSLYWCVSQIPEWTKLVNRGLTILTQLSSLQKGFFKREKQQEMKAHRARLQGAPTAVSNPAATGD